MPLQAAPVGGGFPTPVNSNCLPSRGRVAELVSTLVASVPAAAFLAAISLLAPAGRAEDADRYRPYLQWRSYEWDTIWGVDDANGVSLGANFDRHWGGELALDAFQLGLRNTSDQLVAELTSISLIPQARFRWPCLDNRLVPYAIAGVGASFVQFNDRKSHGFGVDIQAEDWLMAVSSGVGIEYFLDDEIAFGFEGKYLWIDPLQTSIGGVSGERDMSSFMLSFGLRMYFDENNPRPLADLPDPVAKSASRFYFGMKGGFHTILDGNWGHGVKLTPLANAWGHSMNQHYGFTLGMNLNRNWSFELGLDGGETDITVDNKYAIGEYAQAAVIPQIRYRYPLTRGRWVPYVLAGGGMLYAEFNDAKPQSVLFPGVDPKGFYPVARGGLGVEYFFTRNFSFAGEANYQYTWDQEIWLHDRGTVRGDFSTFQALMMFRVYLFNL